MKTVRRILLSASLALAAILATYSWSTAEVLTVCAYMGSGRDVMGKEVDIWYCFVDFEDGTYWEWWTATPRERQPVSPQ